MLVLFNGSQFAVSDYQYCDRDEQYSDEGDINFGIWVDFEV